MITIFCLTEKSEPAIIGKKRSNNSFNGLFQSDAAKVHREQVVLSNQVG